MWRKFWKRKDKDPGQDAIASSVENFAGVLPLARSTKETLGLQQLIGNQAVLRLLAAERREKLN
jgi:hypothetical protein